MKITREKLTSKYQSSGKIKYLCYQYASDLKHLKNLSLQQFFDFVRLIPYDMDEKPIEVVKRPSLILKDNQADCKKKSILCGAYFVLNEIPFRFIGSSLRPTKVIHHIFPQIYVGKKWMNFDATYSNYKMFQPKTKLTNACIL